MTSRDPAPVGRAPSGAVVAVCIPTLGRAALVERSLPSVLGQDVALEVVVALNGPDPVPTGAPLDDPRVRVLSVPEGGVASARNAAARASAADLLLFLDDDDALRPGALARLTALAADPAVVFASGGAEVTAPDGRRIDGLGPRPLGPLFGDLWGSCLAGSFIVRRRLFDHVGGYDEHLTFGENHELCMRLGQAMAAGGGRSAHTDEVVLDYQQSSQGYGRRAADSGLRVLEVHGPVLARHPALHAQWEALVGVALWRDGRRRQARQHLRIALRRRPLDGRHWYRLALSWAAPLARRRWAGGGERWRPGP